MFRQVTVAITLCAPIVVLVPAGYGHISPVSPTVILIHAGYGYINPVSPYGKMTCILFALLGIPFTLVFLSALGRTGWTFLELIDHPSIRL